MDHQHSLPLSSGAASRRTTRKRHVLIADDSAPVRAAFSRLLAAQGYEVFTAEEGRAVLEIVAREEVDVVLLDLAMPGLNGWHVLEELRERWPDLPVIIVTAQSGEADSTRAQGAHAHLEKPPDIPMLLDAIAEATRSPRDTSGISRQGSPKFRTSPPEPFDFPGP